MSYFMTPITVPNHHHQQHSASCWQRPIFSEIDADADYWTSYWQQHLNPSLWQRFVNILFLFIMIITINRFIRYLYSMIIWNWNKVNSYISALKPLPRVPNRSKWPWCWDILIFETSGTSTSFGKCQWFYKCTIYIDEIWVESTTRYLWKHGYTLQQPPKHPKTIKNHPQAPQTHPLFPRNSVDYSQALMKHSERHSSCQGMSEKTLGGGNRSEGACWVSEMSVIV